MSKKTLSNTGKNAPKQQSQKPKVLTFQQARKLARNIHMAYYILAAQKLGISYKVILPGLFVEFTKGNKSWKIHKSLTPINNSVSMALASYKNTCNKYLSQQGLPVPKQEAVTQVEQINAFVKKLSKLQSSGCKPQIVIKPNRGFGGSGVTILPSTKREIESGFHLAHQKSLSKSEPKVLVEEFVAGENYRLLVLGNKVIAAAHRLSASVTGDGKNPIQNLITKKNKQLKKLARPTILVDAETDQTLAKEQMTLNSVPVKGQIVRLRINCNLCSGGSTRECLGEVHKKYLQVAIDATTAIGLKLTGVDLITPDITNPNVKFAINEVNHDPGLRIHYMPDEGKVSDVAVQIQKFILTNL
ncbi:MAG: ATP-grasp domain-containing protein [Patescibacteria group bacterium]|nr:ATP-grasp domain-containing protein [Patescibacteria group bacterium]